MILNECFEIIRKVILFKQIDSLYYMQIDKVLNIIEIGNVLFR